jgi:predicted DNA-binding transcriptional regulator AlpA
MRERRWQLLTVPDSYLKTGVFAGEITSNMSTNIQIKRICKHCKKLFIAKTTVTRYCSHRCNQRDYKLNKKKKKMQRSKKEIRQKMMQEVHVSKRTPLLAKELINIKELSILTSVSERTLFRMIKEDNFPKTKIRRRLVFNRNDVMNFFNNKYGTL